VIDGIHMLTGASFPATVKASGIPASAEGFDAVELAAITVEYPGGQLVTLSLNAEATIYREDRWELTSIDCEAGRAEITPNEYTDWKMSTKMSTSGKAGLIVPSWQRRIANASDVATRAHIANFLNAVRGKESVHAPVSAAFGGTLVCQMANLSIRTGRTAHWNPTDQQVKFSKSEHLAVIKLAEQLFIRWPVFRNRTAHPSHVHIVLKRDVLIGAITTPDSTSHAGSHRHPVGECAGICSGLRLANHNPADRRNQR
jgi:hypothetical protein